MWLLAGREVSSSVSLVLNPRGVQIFHLGRTRERAAAYSRCPGEEGAPVKVATEGEDQVDILAEITLGLETVGPAAFDRLVYRRRQTVAEGSRDSGEELAAVVRDALLESPRANAL